MSRVGGKRINKVTNPEQYNVGIYIRTGKVIKGIDATVFQKDRNEEYCEDMNLNVIKIYSDIGVDTFAKKRPVYEELINDIKAGKINMIVTANLTRIARSHKEMLDLIELQKEYNFRTLFTDSREELLGDRTKSAHIEDYMVDEEDLELEEYEDEEDMEF